MRPDVEEFYGGISFDCYRLLGAHPAGRGWNFTVWAPNARRVQVLGDWNGWDLYHPEELCFCEDGLWRGQAPAARAGQCYKYNLLGPDGVWRLRADPFAFAFEGLPGTSSRLAAPDYPFADGDFLGGRSPGFGQPVNIYELHAGSWRRHWDGRYYSGPELAGALIPWLLAHHYTHVEFLPLAEHPFDGSWGYQGTGYFAPTARLGGFAGFAALVDALHGAGIGVLMDFVPVHFAPDEGFLAHFDGTPLFEAGASDWGSLNFNLASGPVRSFLLSSAAFWLHVCHCDGLRVDAIGNALYRDNAGAGAADFFMTLTAGLHARCPGCLLVAEDTAGFLNATAPTHAGGLGFDYVWDTAWAHDAAALLAAPPEARPAAAARLCAGIDGFWRANHLNALSHDDNAPPAGSLLARLWGDAGQKQRQARLLYLLQYARPGKKLNFMGNELGVWHAFDAYREPDWGILADGIHRAFSDYCGALGALYAAHPALHRQEYDPGGFAWALRGPVFGWLRMAEGEALLCAFNPLWEGRRETFDVRGFRRAEPLFACNLEAAPASGDGRLTLDLPALSGGIWRLW